MDQSLLRKSTESIQTEYISLKALKDSQHANKNFFILGLWIFSLFWAVYLEEKFIYFEGISIIMPFASSIILFFYFLFGKMIYENRMMKSYFRTKNILNKLEEIFILNKEADKDIKNITSQITIIDSIIDSLKQIWGKKFSLYFPMTLSNIFELIRQSQNDLIEKIEEHILWIKLAQTDLSKNLSWNDELSQMVRLQKSRLDRQIEQFEELQRTLIKI